MIANRRKFRTQQARKRERIRVALKSTAILIGTVLFGALLVYATHLDFLRFKLMTIDTDGVIEQNTLASALSSTVEGKFYGLVPKDTVFRLSHQNIEQSLLEQFPRIESIDFVRSGLYDLYATAHERTPAALWCGDVVPTIAYLKMSEIEDVSDSVWGTCYLLDKNGYIYARAPQYSGNVLPRYYGSLEKAEPIAQQYLQEEDFVRWQRFNDMLTENNLPAHAILFVDEHDAEVYLVNGLKLLVPRDEDVEVVVRRLFSLLDSGSVDTEKEVEYVDLRFGNKAFVKYFGDYDESVENGDNSED